MQNRSLEVNATLQGQSAPVYEILAHRTTSAITDLNWSAKPESSYSVDHLSYASQAGIVQALSFINWPKL